MAEDESEIKIPITAEADLTGFEETTQAAQEMQTAVEQSATQTIPAQQQAAEQVEKAAAAKQKERKAAEEAAVAEDKLRRQMELAKKSRNELIRELERLAKLRKEAAASGDTEAFERLTAQSAECREAFEKLNQGLELTNIQFTQQAQMGMMAGQTLGSIGQMAAEGGGNVAGMAAQFLALGQAIKAGLGPVGWAMMALQGLQMAWDHFTKKQEEARKAAEESEKALAKLNETLLQHAEAAARASYEAQKGYIDERADVEQKAAEEALEAMDRQHAAEQKAAAQRIELLRAETDQQKALLDAKLAAGQITQQQHDAELRTLDYHLKQQERLEADAADRRKHDRLRAEEEMHEELAKMRRGLAQELERQMAPELERQWTETENARYADIVGQYEALKKVIEARKATVETINKQMEAEKAADDRDEEKIRELRRRRTEAEEDILDANDRLKDLDAQATEEFKGIMESAAYNEEARHMTGVHLLQYAHTVNRQLMAANEAADAAWDGVENARRQQEELRADGEARDAARQAESRRAELAQEAAEIAQEAADREREWGDVQQQGLAAQKEWLEAQLTKLAEGSELWDDYSARLKTVNEAMAAERVAALTAVQPARRYAAADARTQEEIYQADRQLLEGKLAKLRAELSGGQNLSPAMRQQLQKQVTDAERQLAGLAQAELRSKMAERMAAVNGMATTQNYQVRDRRTQRQIMEADAAILSARRADLRNMLKTPGLDVATQQQINDALRATERQIAGVQEAWRDNRAASARWLRELQPPQLQAKSKAMQRGLDATAAAYARTAKQAERAAQKGDTKALERYQKRMQHLADVIDRRAKDSQAGARLQRQADDALRSLSRQQVAQEQAATGSARAAQRKRKADETAARNAERDARKTAGTARREQTKVQQLNSELTSTRAAMARMEAEHGRLKSEISALAAAVTNCANAASQGAAAAASGAAAAAAATNSLQRQVSRLQKQIDRLNRKI